jgi:hypothetical protein
MMQKRSLETANAASKGGLGCSRKPQHDTGKQQQQQQHSQQEEDLRPLLKRQKAGFCSGTPQAAAAGGGVCTLSSPSRPEASSKSASAHTSAANELLPGTSPDSRTAPDLAAAATRASPASKSALISFKKSILPISKFVVVVPAEIMSRVLFGGQQRLLQGVLRDQQEGYVEHRPQQEEQEQLQQQQDLKDLEKVLVRVVKDGVEEDGLLQVNAEKTAASSRGMAHAGNRGVDYR